MYTYYFFKLLLFSYTTTKNGWNLFLISPPKKLNLTCWLYGISLSVPITLRDVWECVSTLLLGRYNFAAALFSKSLIMRIEKYLHSQKWIMQTHNFDSRKKSTTSNIIPRSNKGIQAIYSYMVFNQVSCQKWSGAWLIIEMVY